MNTLQKTILNIIQTAFPIEPRPFEVLATQLECSSEDVIAQITQLKHDGIIRRLGAVFDAARLGYVSTLVAAKVPAEKVDAFVAGVNTLPGVSHNYGRDHAFNVWFTLTDRSPTALEDTIARLRREHQLQAIYSLPARKLYKLSVDFNLDDTDAEESPLHQASARPTTTTPQPVPRAEALTEAQIALVRQLQQDLPLTRTPFAVIAERIDTSEDALLRQIKDWLSSGLIRRFGVAIRHQQVGFTANAMVVFQFPPDQLDRAGRQLAQYPQVSHCYHRPPAPDWPYNLFAMTHARSDAQLRQLIDNMVAQIKPSQYDILRSTAEYKKESVKYFTH